VAALHRCVKEFDMPILTAQPAGVRMFREMQELAQLPSAAQRYIRRSLDIRFKRWENLSKIARNDDEAVSVDRQIVLYNRLDAVRNAIPGSGDDDASVTRFISMAAEVTAFDLGQQKLRSFAAYRFLYERLLGAAARPWLLSVFVMCATLADLEPAHRVELVRSIDPKSAANHWSSLEPQFVPEWVTRLAG
jgi:hypothetical protein